MNWSIKTERLLITKPKPDSQTVDLFYDIWTNPNIMTNVGFPQGLRMSKGDIKKQIQKEYPDEFDRTLLVSLKDSNIPIGECKLGSPDDDNIAGTDVKLLPKYHRKSFGTEIKRVLIEYLFTNTQCEAVKGTPNKNNIASIKMQEAVGGKRIKESSYHFPENMKEYTTDVYYYEYLVFRSDWENNT